MRAGLIITLLASFALAQSGEIKDGKLTEKAWNLTYEVEGLERGISTQQPNIIFEGRSAGSVQIEIAVLEGAEKMDGAKWRDAFLKAQTARKRKMDELKKSEEGLVWITFTETKLDVFTEEHGYAFYPRGTQCFLVHAYVADKTDKSNERIKKALSGLKLGEDPGMSIMVLRVASQLGLPAEHPLVLWNAGIAYIQVREPAKPNYPMAAKLLTQARKVMKDDSFDAVQLWVLYEYGGLAYLSPPLRDTKTALDWHLKAEEAAKKLTAEQGRMQRQAQSAYNAACAYSLMGEVDKGFEALRRAFAEHMAVDKAHLTKDTDLDNLKKNQELWDKFWKEKVEGR
ncbi:MAG: TPR end-of-group domain-containing protein [Planctomycetota bacterium]|jgi:hypothetical protein